MGHVVWSVREGKAGDLDAPEIMNGYRASHPGHEPGLGDFLHLRDGSGPWRVIDRAVGDRFNSPENVLVVELFGD